MAEEEEGDDDDGDERSVHRIENTAAGVKATAKPTGPKEWVSLGVGDIVVDSAADESCWPKGQGGAFETKPSRRNIILKTANGGEMGHYGEKEITFRSGKDDGVVGLRFQVTVGWSKRGTS